MGPPLSFRRVSFRRVSFRRVSFRRVSFRRVSCERVSSKRAFTLIELLVVIAVIAVLVALLLPATQQVREAARKAKCKSNLKQIALAIHNYHDTVDILPSGQYWCLPGTPCNNGSYYAHGWGWSASILPYVDQAALYHGFNFSLPPRDAYHVNLLATPLTLFQCPSDATRKPVVPPSALAFRPERIATSNYCGNGGSFSVSFEAPFVAQDENWTNGVLGRDSARRFRDITDGLSNTILVGEVIHYDFPWDPALYGHWDPPSRTACCTLTLARHGNRALNPGFAGTVDERRESFSSLHAGGAHFALCDGSVRFISENIDNSSRQRNSATLQDPFDRAHGGADYRTYQRLFSRNDGLLTGEY